MGSLRFISFFAGIGGIDLGLERAGHVCVGQVEIDPFCLKVLNKHWPDIPKWGDIREVDPSELPEADLWTGGFPCQDISNAGKRAGIRGERSGLFFDFMRLVRQVRPRYILLENVSALLARGMGDVLGELAESGFDAEWDIVSACAVGCTHLRRRLFIVAHAEGCRWVGAQDQAERWRTQASAEHRSQQAEPAGRRAVDGLRWRRLREPRVARVVDAVPAEVDAPNRALGNAVVPQVAEYIGRLLYEATEAHAGMEGPGGE